MKQFCHQCHHHCFHGCCDWHRHRKTTESSSSSSSSISSSSTSSLIASIAKIASYLQIISTKFLLEVMGASGAIWGCSDILSLRNAPDGATRIRSLAILVGVIFLVRYWWHMKHWWQFERDYLPIHKMQRAAHRCACFQMHASNFVLQVLGGAGAIWGCSEAIMLRHANNAMEWRMASMVVGSVFLIRWMFQIAANCSYLVASWWSTDDPSSIRTTILQWYEMLVVKLVLEVFGATGAVWGFSEVVTLRNSDTNRFWRPIAIGIGVIYLVRWICHLTKFVQSERESVAAAERVAQVDVDDDDDVTGPDEFAISEVADLQLKESTDTLNTTASLESLKSLDVSVTSDEHASEFQHQPAFPSLLAPPKGQTFP
mmetsp:Transcript_3993/g.7078  ORF Transcript_3993/g.7078 Transcript_3993/m.7078 type:complete len:371 (-) Transcript_3993:139-1251(-)